MTETNRLWVPGQYDGAPFNIYMEMGDETQVGPAMQALVDLLNDATDFDVTSGENIQTVVTANLIPPTP